MKLKTTELQGSVLDRAVAKCEKLVNEDGLDVGFIRDGAFIPSIDWVQGGPIIELEGTKPSGAKWCALGCRDMECERVVSIRSMVQTPLVAAMRCYVASVLGDEVEVPNELV
jgi:hypothetical protein